jgi:2'-5' RNA ligase
VSPRGTYRLFAAVGLPAAVNAELCAWARSWLTLPGVRLVAPRNIHLTLAFLGERPVDEVETLRDAIEGFTATAPHLEVGAPTLLPRRSPRTIGVEIADPEGELAALQHDLAGQLAALGGWGPARRRFHPHVTVARMHAGTVLGPAPATPALRFEPLAVELVRSHLAPAGAEYETLAGSPLGPR